ncbi:hypothetical protein [Microbacterium sp. 22242]|uniref:hypothetical protein n=1 Tax=Microbacterium sp. 22242 TaxID=3453896 RepID=UPI003F847934
MSNPNDTDPQQDADGMPADEQLAEPSTEKEPGQEPKAEKPDDPEPSHEAVGIGVIPGAPIEPATDDADAGTATDDT